MAGESFSSKVDGAVHSIIYFIMKYSQSFIIFVATAAAVWPVCLGNEFCCYSSRGGEDPCNPERWNCKPIDQLNRYMACGRRGSSDCKYDAPGAVHEACCSDNRDCFISESLAASCYLSSDSFGGGSTSITRLCTTRGFYFENGVPWSGFSGTICGDGGFGGLDPHFETWNGTWYDYMGVCDLVFLHAPDFADGLGLEVHIRTKERGSVANSYKYTFVESVALKVGNGHHILQVDSWGEYMLNGKRNSKLPSNVLGGMLVQHIVDDEKNKRERFIVGFDREEKLVISVFKDLVSVQVKGGTHHSFGTSKGLMGAFGSGTKLARNNSVIIDGDSTFAEEWQVRDTDPKLFALDRHPQYPEKCGLEESDDVLEVRRRHLRESSVSKSAAKIACAKVKNKDACINDVLQMNDLDLADAFPRD